MKKSCSTASVVWCAFFAVPYLFIKASVHIEFGFYSFIYGLVYFFFETFEQMTLDRIFFTIILSTIPLLVFASFVCIICSKGKKIHVLTILATLGELLFQLMVIAILEKKTIVSFFSPFCVFLLLLWLIYIRRKQTQHN